jgi:hypothetical protein
MKPKKNTQMLVFFLRYFTGRKIGQSGQSDEGLNGLGNKIGRETLVNGLLKPGMNQLEL